MPKMKETMLYRTELKRNYIISKTKQSMKKLKTVVLLWTVCHLGLFSNTVLLKMVNMTYLGLYIIMGVFKHSIYGNGCFHH
jgi:hypothetical protein